MYRTQSSWMKHALSVAAVVATTLGSGACAPIGAALGSPVLERIGQSLDESLRAEAEGRIEDAIGIARQAASDPEIQSFPVVRQRSLQRLGLALAKAGQLDQADAVAREMDSLPTKLRGMPVRAAIAYCKCEFAEAANFELWMRAVSTNGVNDRPTEANLAAIDEAEGRFLRALDRLEHVAKTQPHPQSDPKVNAVLDAEVPVAIARIRSRLGVNSDYAKVVSEQARPDPLLVAQRYADNALRSQKNVYQAYNMLVGGLLFAQSRQVAPETLEPSQQQLHKLVDAYRATPSPCAQAIPDPTLLETPANRAAFFPWMNLPQGPQVAAIDDGKSSDSATGYLAGREIHLNRQIPFDYNSDKIKADGASVLDWLATFLLQHPELGTIFIEGHTDDQGTEQYNLDLSNRRVKAVVAALITRSVPTSRLIARGYGKAHPKISGTDDTSRAANRRVEILVSGVEVQGATDKKDAKVTQ